jgi:dTDP-4-amino-4,6-dideoxygalactose transaminase
VSCWINIGYEVIFTDVSPANLNMTSTHLKEIFEKDINKEIGTVFYTALLGFFGDLNECKRLTEEHGARFLMDNCEATLSAIGLFPNKVTDLLNFSTCSTSLFYSHFSTSGTEGGLVICEDEDEANFYRMMRSHGLTRGMPEKYKNPKVSPEFDFALMGSNYRSSNLQAYMALLDFKRSIKYSIRNRFSILNEFYLNIDRSKFDNFWQEERGVVTPLALPIICKTDELKIKAELYCKSNGIMTRPIIGGVLCEHTAFKGKCDSNDYPIALNAHRRGFYIGLNKNVTKKMAKELALELNQL